MVTGNMESGMIGNSVNYASSARDGEGIPSPQQQEAMLDAWRDALGQVLHRRDSEWRQQLRAVNAESLAAISEMRASAAEIRSAMEAMIANRLAQIREPADGLRGESGPRGEPGPPGVLKLVHECIEGAVHYVGDLVTHGGSTYQAQCDTARVPPCDDWICVAQAGTDGCNGRSLKIKGLFNAEASYRALDIVALNGGSFVARCDDPGPCPGDGWQLMASQGKRGDKGERGLQGVPGVPIFIAKWQLDSDTYTAVPIMSDGRKGPPLELRSLFEQFHSEAQ
ncbi:hypothetical protein JQ595_16545 [Bradyrhizobium japonicum]|uniref:hypothetical protein n=1 Tax=Bradyrhizobium japonicum TaxID=375 RepID=UPI001BA5B905|nr:hypothetical protein [Bradyrhizobium japonicum]MBR0730362.1 hypothetical protein [Bradyrhizobium japonicum]